MGLGSAVFIQVGIMSGSGCEAPLRRALIFWLSNWKKGLLEANSTSNASTPTSIFFLDKDYAFFIEQAGGKKKLAMMCQKHPPSLRARYCKLMGLEDDPGFLLGRGTIFRGYTP